MLNFVPTQSLVHKDSPNMTPPSLEILNEAIRRETNHPDFLASVRAREMIHGVPQDAEPCGRAAPSAHQETSTNLTVRRNIGVAAESLGDDRTTHTRQAVATKGRRMPPTLSPHIRELAHRRSANLEVTLESAIASCLDLDLQHREQRRQRRPLCPRQALDALSTRTPTSPRRGSAIRELREAQMRRARTPCPSSVRPPRARAPRPDQLEPRRKHRVTADPGDRDDAVLDRLPERLEHGSRELGELVEKQHASVCEGDLARPRARAASDDGGHRHAVVRRPKRRLRDERLPGREESRDRMDPRHLERLASHELREDPRKPAREHGLPRAWRSHQQQVVRADGCDLERTPGALLAAHVSEVRGGDVLGRAVGKRLVPRRLDLSAEVGHDLSEVTYRHRLDARERDLGGRLGCADDMRESRSPRSLGDGERARYRPDASVESKLADRSMRRQPLRRQLSRRTEHGERDGQIEARSLLAQRRRCQVDGYPPVDGPLERGRDDSAPHTVVRGALIGRRSC